MLNYKFEYLFNNSFNEWKSNNNRKWSVQAIPEIEIGLYVDSNSVEVGLSISFLFFMVTGIIVIYKPNATFNLSCKHILINLNILPTLWIASFRDKSYLIQIKFLFWTWYIDVNNN